MADLSLRATGRVVSVPPAVDVPAGRLVELPGRGTTFLVDTGVPNEAAAGRPTLVLLHALACTGLLCWYPTIAALRSRYRIVTFDQRWHGQGIRSPQFSLDDCADDAIAVADLLGLERVMLAGFSMGSLVTQVAWHRHPDRVDGAIMCAAAARFTPPGREPAALRVVSTRLGSASQRRLLGQSPAVLANAVAAAALVTPDDHNRWALRQLRTTPPSAISGAAAVISRFDSSGWIGKMDIPVAVVVTTQDRVVTPDRQRWLARQIKNATVYEVDAGHASVVMRADKFIPALQAACASVSARISAPR